MIADSPSPQNLLAQESSLYLQQHAQNPVAWRPWGPEAWQTARERNVPVIVSIGYSSCHWCHVMEREVFEDATLATQMNAGYVCIKVDREERPDVDMVYMEALHAMGVQGGWPLNVFCMPDGSPFYGGTYFPPRNWAQLLSEIGRAYTAQPGELQKAADELRQALASIESRAAVADNTGIDLPKAAEQLLKSYDASNGGMGQAPKFPVPPVWEFLLTAGQAGRQATAKTLSAMAYGGIYDHLAGGFCRYSTDERWFAPHFEKMLYDNGQLLSLYAKGYATTLDIHYLDVAGQTVQWLKEQMTDPGGAFYASIDADSEGEEGLFYTWKKAELDEILSPDEKQIFYSLFGIEEAGNWEHGRNILYRAVSEEELGTRLGVGAAAVHRQVLSIRQRLVEVRAARIEPRLDKKIITAWNALANLGLTDAYRYCGHQAALEMAVLNAEFFEDHLWQEGRLLHVHGQPTEAFLDGYAFWILALANLYQATFEIKWLRHARALADRALEAFGDTNSALLYFAGHEAETLITRKKETIDSVTPSGNAAFGLGLHLLSVFYQEYAYLERARAMLAEMQEAIMQHPRQYAVWALLARRMQEGLPEISILGPDAKRLRQAIDALPIPGRILMGGAKSGTLPGLQGQGSNQPESGIYLCFAGTCHPPVATPEQLQDLYILVAPPH